MAGCGRGGVIAHPVWGSFCSPQIKLTVGGGFERRPNTLSQPNSADRNCQRVEHRRPTDLKRRTNSRFIALVPATSCSPQRSPSTRRNLCLAKAEATLTPQRWIIEASSCLCSAVGLDSRGRQESPRHCGRDKPPKAGPRGSVRREYRAIEPVFRFHDDVIADAKPSRSVAWRPPTRPPTDLAAAHRSERAKLATASSAPKVDREGKKTADLLGREIVQQADPGDPL
jgi:hypothetical protein